MPCYTCGDKGLCPLAYVLQIYATFLSQHFDEFLRPAYGINNLSKSLHQFWVWSSEFGVRSSEFRVWSSGFTVCRRSQNINNTRSTPLLTRRILIELTRTTHPKCPHGSRCLNSLRRKRLAILADFAC